MASYKIVFNSNNRLRKDGTSPVVIEVYFDRVTRRYVKTGIYLLPSQWDAAKSDIKVTNALLAGYRAKINAKLKQIQDHEAALLMKGMNLKPDDLNIIFNPPPPPATQSFTHFFTNEIEDNNTLKPESRRPYRNTLRLLNRYKEPILFSEIDYNLIHGFDQWLHTTLNVHEAHYHTNTIHGHHRRLKRMIHLAMKRKMLSEDPYLSMERIKTVPSTRAYLNPDELKEIEDCTVDDPKVIRAKDMFLFSCYCGLRYSDMQNLCPDHLVHTTEGWNIDLQRMIKVPQPVYLPLHSLFDGKPEQILLQYMVGNKKRHDKIFPTSTNQDINRNLKLLQGYAKINKLLTFHVSRHTFGSMLAMISNDPFLIMSLMGHRKLETSMLYIKNSKEMITTKVQGLDWNKLKGNGKTK